MNPALRPATAFRILHRTAALTTVLMALVWLASSVMKLVNLSAFSDIVIAHNVLPASMRWTIPALPWIECALAFLLVASRERSRLRSIALVMSASLLMFFLFYLHHVDPATLARVGCGCGVKNSVDTTGAAKLFGFLAAHAVAATQFIPVRTEIAKP